MDEVSYDDESGENRRKIRRIIEKRTSQKVHSDNHSSEGNKIRFRERRQSGKQVKNIFGSIPYAYTA